MQLLLLALIFGLVSAPAAATNMQWRIINSPYLQGQFADGEGDPVFWVYCRPGRIIDVGLSGQIDVGAGEGEAVTVTLSSGGTSVSLRGVSLKSGETGRVELRTSVSENDPLFEILSTGKAITVTGAASGSMTWETDGLRSRIANFLRQCR